MDIPVVFITGSASGVGLHLTERFVQSGYRVLATDINISVLKDIAAERKWPSERVWCRKLDVANKASWRSLWSALDQKWGRVDIALNVAAYLKPGRIHETDMAEIDRHMDINVKGLIYGSKLAAESMVRQGYGQIINIASLAGVAPIPGISLYSTSKFAVRGFSLALAQELRPLGVKVTVVCPDAIETPMLTLQEDYEEAAMTFSGEKTLTVEDIGAVIFDDVLKNAPVEVLLPGYRGWLAKLGNVVPRLSFALGDFMSKRGRTKQASRKSGSRTLRTG